MHDVLRLASSCHPTPFGQTAFVKRVFIVLFTWCRDAARLGATSTSSVTEPGRRTIPATREKGLRILMDRFTIYDKSAAR
jgi:hypothetical protein